MMNFINNGGLEFLLAMGYVMYVVILAKIEDRKTYQKEKSAKWHW